MGIFNKLKSAFNWNEKKEIVQLESQLANVRENCVRKIIDIERLEIQNKKLDADMEVYGAQSFICSILPTLDNLEIALKVTPTTDEGELLHKNMQGIRGEILQALEACGVKMIETVGQPFDPNFHQAVQVVDMDGFEKSYVVEEYQKGYELNGRVIRASMVSVQA